jgi:hypothetical protein
VVATQNEEVLGVLDLVGEEQADGLEGLLATVDVVAQEQVVGLGGEATILEQSQKIVVLAVDIAANLSKTNSVSCFTQREKEKRDFVLFFSLLPTQLQIATEQFHRNRPTYLNRSLQLKEDGLRDENLTGLGAQEANLALEELDLLSGPAASDFEQPVNYRVEIDLVLVCHLIDAPRGRNGSRLSNGWSRERLLKSEGGGKKGKACWGRPMRRNDAAVD